MVLPSTWSAVLYLLISALFCFGLWPLLYRVEGPRYRFEVFSLDFAVGAVLLALAAAYSFGTMGAELSFSDTMLVSGRRSQVMAFSAGGIFALGNMLLLCTISLVGLSRAALISSSAAALVLGCLSMTGANFLCSIFGVCLFVMSLLVTAVAAQSGPARKPQHKAAAEGGSSSSTGKSARNPGRPSGRNPLSKNAKGIITGIISGVSLGSVLPVVRLAQTEELPIGPYGGILMACLGMLVTTPLLNFYFMNLAIEGEPLAMIAYLRGGFKQRLSGVAAGVIWCVGALSLYIAFAAAKSLNFSGALIWIVPFVAASIAVICASLGGIGEGAFRSSKRNMVFGALALFVCGAILLSLAHAQDFKA